VVHSLELDLVLESLLQLGSTENVLDLSQFSVLSLDGSVHHLPVLVREDTSSLLHHLSIVTILVSPLAVGQFLLTAQSCADLHVLDSGLGQVLIDMVESVLGNVTDSKSGVLADTSLLGNSLTSQELDQGRFTSSVGANDTDSRRERKRTRDSLERRSGSTGVSECSAIQLHDGTSVGSDTHQGSGRGESEFDGSSREGVVGLCLGNSLNELGQVSVVVSKLLLLVVDLTLALPLCQLKVDSRYRYRHCPRNQSRARRSYR
jgi:hypothetical protein